MRKWGGYEGGVEETTSKGGRRRLNSTIQSTMADIKMSSRGEDCTNTSNPGVFHCVKKA